MVTDGGDDQQQQQHEQQQQQRHSLPQVEAFSQRSAYVASNQF